MTHVTVQQKKGTMCHRIQQSVLTVRGQREQKLSFAFFEGQIDSIHKIIFDLLLQNYIPVSVFFG